MNMLSQYIFKYFKEKSKLFDNTIISTSYNDGSDDSELDTDDSDQDDDYDNTYSSNDESNRSFDELIDDDDDNDENLKSIKNNFQGMNMRDNIHSEDRKSYFKIKINEKIKYLHKQSACWILTDENAHIYYRPFDSCPTNKLKQHMIIKLVYFLSLSFAICI